MILQSEAYPKDMPLETSYESIDDLIERIVSIRKRQAKNIDLVSQEPSLQFGMLRSTSRRCRG